MRVIAVTGGAGYIGSHTCRALADRGFLPVVIDNLCSGHEWAVRWGPLEQGDIRDADFLDRVFGRWSPEAVIHFAGLIQVGESVLRPDIYYGNNVLGTMTLLERMRAHHIGRMVFSSSCAVFGMPATSPLNEDLPIRPINPYGASKAMVEQLLADYAKAFGLRAIALRYFNAAGAQPDGSLGEAHRPETHLIPLAIEVALGKRPHLQIYGDDYPTSDGTCVRDFIHVADLAAAHLLALERMERTDGFDAFNLGNGTGYTVRQVVDAIMRVSGRAVPVLFSSRRSGDSPSLVADATKARRTLGWQPAMPALDDIVRTAWNWHSSGIVRINSPVGCG